MPQSAVPRIVITGIGVVSPFGVGRERFWSHVSRGCSGTNAITEFDASELPSQVAAPITGVTVDDLPTLRRRRTARQEQPRRSEALLAIGPDRRDRCARGLGDAGHTSVSRTPGSSSAAAAAASTSASVKYYDFFVERGKKVTPYAIPISIVGMVSSEISISLRLRGVSHVLSCGCTSSTDAIGYAAAHSRRRRWTCCCQAARTHASRRA